MKTLRDYLWTFSAVCLGVGAGSFMGIWLLHLLVVKLH